MDYFELDTTFRRTSIIDDFISTLWTERYQDPGEIILVVPKTTENLARYPLDGFIGKEDTKEVMWIHTREIKNNQITIKGASLSAILKERIFKYPTAASADPDTYIIDDNPSEIIHTIIRDMIAPESGNALGPQGLPGTIYGDNQNIITNLEPGSVTVSLADKKVSVTYGILWDVVASILKDNDLGFRLYLDSATDSDYTLKYDIYQGTDRTDDQTTAKAVIFSEQDGTFYDVEELHSKSDYKNVAFAYASQVKDLTDFGYMGQTYAAGATTSIDFTRRLGFISATDFTADQWVNATQTIIDMQGRGQKLLAEHKAQSLVDGEIDIRTKYKYGSDFNLGDLVTLESASGIKTDAKITEFIWSHDETGERGYPTIEILP